jgi:hypothetical protein
MEAAYIILLRFYYAPVHIKSLIRAWLRANNEYINVASTREFNVRSYVTQAACLY